MTSTLEDQTQDSENQGARESALVPMLVVAFCAPGFARAGEVLVSEPTPRIFGRGDEASGDEPRAVLVRQRPGRNEIAPPLDNAFLSRDQLRIVREGERIRVENIGKRPLLVRGEVVTTVSLGEGEVCTLKGQMVLVCVRRPRVFPAAKSAQAYPSFPFGTSDPHGIVGESAAAWELRDQIAFIAKRAAHVLILGESGTGKELVARAVHALSSRKDRSLVARNASTLPPGLIDAELFGNVVNYPNAGMPARTGLIGEASGSTLFLDEIGELPLDLQTHLLRVLDAHGEYQRLGESKSRTADLRFVAATNRPANMLKHDLVARMRLRLTVVGLGDRREDIPLLIRHILRRDAAQDPELARRFLKEGEPQVSPALVEALLVHHYEAHTRELDALLWRSLASSPAGVAELTDDVAGELALPALARAPRSTEVTAEEIQSSLEKNAFIQEKVWRDLGLASRHVLTRLLRKYGLSGRPK